MHTGLWHSLTKHLSNPKKEKPNRLLVAYTCSRGFVFLPSEYLHLHSSVASDSSSWCVMLFSDRPWTTISTRAPRPTGHSTILWKVWALWLTISQTSLCPQRHVNPAKGRHPTTCAIFASTKDTTSKTVPRWAAHKPVSALHQSSVDPHAQWPKMKQLCTLWAIFWAVYQMCQCVLKNIQSAVW